MCLAKHVLLEGIIVGKRPPFLQDHKKENEVKKVVIAGHWLVSKNV
jgi:hypothetical protein